MDGLDLSRLGQSNRKGRYFPAPVGYAYMSDFDIHGRFQSRDGYQSFQKSIDAPNADVARDRVYSQIGSQHGLKRTQIEIDDISEVASA